MQLLKTQSYNLELYGFRAFSICAPQLVLWNSLSRELRVCHSVGSFKKALKTFLFLLSKTKTNLFMNVS